jgi:hypothetical protein
MSRMSSVEAESTIQDKADQRNKVVQDVWLPKYWADTNQPPGAYKNIPLTYLLEVYPDFKELHDYGPNMHKLRGNLKSLTQSIQQGHARDVWQELEQMSAPYQKLLYGTMDEKMQDEVGYRVYDYKLLEQEFGYHEVEYAIRLGLEQDSTGLTLEQRRNIRDVHVVGYIHDLAVTMIMADMLPDAIYGQPLAGLYGKFCNKWGLKP